MSLGPYFGNGRQGTICSRALFACVALIGVLAARNVLPHFPQATSSHSAVSVDSHHDQRPRFDNSGPRWSAPAESFLPTPPAAESAHLAPVSPLSSSLQSRGFHFNRPPPIS